MTKSRAWPLGLAVILAAGCQTPASQWETADRAAARIIAQKQMEAMARTEPFTVEPSADALRRRLMVEGGLPRSGPASLGSRGLGKPSSSAVPAQGPSGPVVLSLTDALQVAARSSAEYQSQKEKVFLAALALDLERHRFGGSFSGSVEGELTSDGSTDPSTNASRTSGQLSFTRLLRNGISFTAALGADLVKLLTGGGGSTMGLLADASVSIPLLRGSGQAAVETLTQAERDALYAVWEFERFKQTFAVRVADDYYSVLVAQDQLGNAEENHRSLVLSRDRARRLADAGRLPEIQYDQAVQDELRARSRWIQAQGTASDRLDAFKARLGLPPDAAILLSRSDMERLENLYGSVLADDLATPSGGGEPVGDPGPSAQPEVSAALPAAGDTTAVRTAIEARLDLRVALEKVKDALRGITVSEDALKADLSLKASASAGERRTASSADLPDAELSSVYGSALLSLGLPLDRTAERNAYRESYVALERAVRDLQGTEDQVKLDVRQGLRSLLQAKEEARIQGQAVTLARRRVRSTDLFLQAGRAEIRDLLDAQESLLAAQNAYAEALAGWRIAELALRRDTGTLTVDASGLWKEPTDTANPTPSESSHE